MMARMKIKGDHAQHPVNPVKKRSDLAAGSLTRDQPATRTGQI